MLKISNVQNAYIHGKAVTLFSIYFYDVRCNRFVYGDTDCIEGHYTCHKTLARKHCENEGTVYNANEWQFYSDSNLI